MKADRLVLAGFVFVTLVSSTLYGQDVFQDKPPDTLPVSSALPDEQSDAAARESSPDSYSDVSITCPLKQGNVEVLSGPLSATGIRSRLDTIHYTVKKLYRKRLRKTLSITGSLCLYFEIDENGRTGNISFVSNTLNDPEIENGLITALEKRKFRKSRKNKEITRATWYLEFDPEKFKKTQAETQPCLLIMKIIPAILLFLYLINMPHYR
jgi:hypothetical protein